MPYPYQYSLMILSLFLVVASAFIALGTASRIRSQNKKNILWVLGGGVSLGLGIWMMHLIGILSFPFPGQLAFDKADLFYSISSSILSSVVVLYLITMNRELDLLQNIVGAIFVAAGMMSMHFILVNAMRLFPEVNIDADIVMLSFAMSFFASFYIIRIGYRASNRDKFLSLRNLMSSLVIGLSFFAMYYFGQLAMEIDTSTISLAVNSGISRNSMGMYLVVLVLLAVFINVLILSNDLRMAVFEGERAKKIAKKNLETLNIARRVTEVLAAQYKESEEFNKKLFDTVANVVMVVDKAGYIVRINKAASNVTGFQEPELTGKQFWQVLVPGDGREEFSEFFDSIVQGNKVDRYEGIIITSNGEKRLLEWYYTELMDDDDEIEFIIATGTDITEQKKYEEEMRLAAVSFETSEAICITDSDSKILRVNAAFTNITGYSEQEVCGKTPAILKSDRHDDDFYKNMWEQIVEKGFWYGEIWNKRKNGEIYPEWLRITAVYNDENELTNYVASFSDITEIKEAEEQIHFFSNFDAATRLPNSKLFTDLLDKELEMCAMDNRKGALLYVELIHLDKLTDNIGMGAVDSYILKFAEILHTNYGTDLTLGRISNTDIAILLDNINDHQVISHSVEMAKYILKVIRQGLLINGHMAYIHASIGIIDYSNKTHSSEELLQHATTAANRSRRLELDSYQFYSSYLQKVATENYQTEVALREAIDQNQFELFLQPQIDIHDNLIGAEALLRWKSGNGMIPPDRFIPIAEESNLIIDIGDWVLKKSVEYIQIIESEDFPSEFKNIAVNVSAIQIQQDDFVTKIKRLIIESDIDPTYLKLELTESAVLERPEIVISKIAALKDIGVTVALDDFGTGYSSLAYLQKMQIDQLKIDRSFVSDLSINKKSQALTETIIVMARNLGMEVIAEGVETSKERAILASYGCTQYQGYFYSRPIEFEAFLDFAKYPIQVEL